jgi:signal transduction histidine kinase
MAEGVLVLDHDLKPVLANRAARDLLGLRNDELPPRVPSEDLLAVAATARDEDAERDATLRLFFPADSTLQVRAAPLSHGRLLITLRDVTQELMSQRVRKEFVSHASHELKSPVASMQALAEAVHKALEDDPEAARRFSERLVAESDRLGRLVGDLLDLSRLEDAGTALTEAVNIAAIVRDEVDQATPSAAEKRIHLKARCSDDVWLRGDEQQLRLLVRNLLENAIRYTHDDGHVDLDVTTTGGHAVVTVRDDGMGIPRDVQARVFERFYRIDRARSRERGGTGLGLAIVKHVAELHGGRVEVSSELGEGSTFTAHLPLPPSEDRVRSIAG